MAGASRRSLAKYGVERLLAGDPVNSLAKALASSLASGGKKKDIELLISDIFEILERRGLLASATITSAKPLSPKTLGSLKSQIVKAAKVKTVVIEEVVDEAVIGGFRVETSTHSWDKTIARKLALIKGGI